MRVISGRARGTVLLAPPDSRTRPTADRIKEDLFNIISRYVADSSFLDLYSGTGQVGIEALSRGAARAVFVESDKHMAELISKNVDKCRLDGAEIVQGDVRNALDMLGRKDRLFDIVFMDPPYETGELSHILQDLIKCRVINDGALIITEQASKSLPIIDTTELQVFKIKEYSATKLTFVKYTHQGGCP